MRRRALIGSILASTGVVVAGFQIGVASHSTATSSSSGSSSGTAKDGTFTGTAIDTQFGTMQVEVVISGGKITDVTVLQSTNREGRSVQISNRADPLLRTEVLQAQSANVATIGGATYTSEGYLQSLQSALDQAGFAG